MSPQFPNTALHTLPVHLILWSVVAVMLTIFLVYSVILLWHWKEYSTGKYTTVGSMLMYLSVSACLFALMAASIMWYSLV